MRLAVTLLFAVSIGLLHAEQSILVVQVSDIQNRPISGLQIRAEGGAIGAPTDVAGIGRIPLSPKTKPGDPVKLLLVRDPRDLVFISPWDREVIVPSFDGIKEIPVVLTKRGNRAILENSPALASATAAILKRTPAHPMEAVASQEERRKAALVEVSKNYGLTPEDVDSAIRAWGRKTEDPYEKGLAALYESRYSEASQNLQESLATRETELKNTQTKFQQAAFYLGESLYDEGKYEDSAAAFEKSAQFAPNDPELLHSWGLSLGKAGDYVRAETIIRRALDISEKAFGPDDPRTTAIRTTLAVVVKLKGDYASAELLLQQALASQERTVGASSEGTATTVNDLATLSLAEGKYVQAEQFARRAICIRRHLSLEVRPDTAVSIHNLGLIHQYENRYAEARSLYRTALLLLHLTVGPTHPDTATAISDLASVLEMEGDYAGAETLYRRSMCVRLNVLGPRHADTANSFMALARLLGAKGDGCAAEHFAWRIVDGWKEMGVVGRPETTKLLVPLTNLLMLTGNPVAAERLTRRVLCFVQSVQVESPLIATCLDQLSRILASENGFVTAEIAEFRALQIRDRLLGHERGETAVSLDNLAQLLQATGDYDGAESFFREALQVNEDVAGKDSIAAAASGNNLASLLIHKGQYPEAESLYERAIAIFGQKLGPTHPIVLAACGKGELFSAETSGECAKVELIK